MIDSPTPIELSGWIPNSATEILSDLSDRIQKDFESIAYILQELAEHDAHFADYEKVTAQLILECATCAIADTQEARADDRVQPTIEGCYDYPTGC